LSAACLDAAYRLEARGTAAVWADAGATGGAWDLLHGSAPASSTRTPIGAPSARHRSPRSTMASSG